MRIIRRVRTQQHLPGMILRLHPFQLRERVTHDSFRATYRTRRSLAQPLCEHHWCGVRSRRDGKDSVQTSHSGVPKRCALFQIPFDLDDRVVNINERELVVRCRQQVWGRVCEGGEETRNDRVELADMPKLKCSQERSERGRCIHSLEQPFHATMSQKPHVLDRVGPGDHACHQRGNLCSRVRAFI